MRTGARGENPLEWLGVAAGQAPDPLFDAYIALMTARTVMAGSSLGVLDALAERPDDAPGLARRLELDEQGADLLLVALHALGYLALDGTRYRPSRMARRWLAPDARRPLRHWQRFTYDMWDAMGGLEETLRTGAPQGLHERGAEDPYWERYMRGLFDLSRFSAPDVARAIGARSPRRMLDLAGGHGGFSMALCDRHPSLRATVVELEGSARIGRRIVAEEGYEGRIEHLVGDLFEVDLGSGHDLAVANSIVHHLTPEQAVALLRRARSALRPGGRMAVFELERPGEGRRGDAIGTLTGLLFHTLSRGRTYSSAQIQGFFAQAGYVDVRAKQLLRAPGNVLVLGDVPGA